MDIAQLPNLAGLLPDPVVVVGPDATITWGNAAAERIFGLTLADVVGRSGLDFVHPDDLEFVTLSMDTVQDKVAGNPIEIRVRGVDGWQLVELVGAPVGDGGVALCLRDLTERRRYEVAHGEEARFRSLVHNAGAVTMLVTAEGLVESVSAAITRLTGIDQEDVLGSPLADLVVAEDRTRISETLRAAASGSVATVTVDVPSPARGGRIPLELAVVDLLDDPTVRGYVVSAHDVTERVAVETELRAALSLLHATLDSTADGILVVDSEGRITSCNRRFAEMWRLSDDILSARDDDAALAAVLDQLADPAAFLRKVEELYAQPEAESYDMLGFSDGRVFERFSLPQRVDGRVVGRVWSFRDLTERKRLEDELVYRAFHDQLTGLPNKARFCDRVQHAAERSERSAEGFAVLFLDIDNFKTVNDSLGHDVGDRLLVSAAKLLGGCLRTGDTPARLGGDEFAVLLEHVSDPETACALAERIRDTFRRPIPVGGRDVVSTVSIGIAFGGRRSTSEQILRDADLAMYTAKSRGKNRFELFESQQHDAAVVRVEVAADLRHANERDELRLVYQPIVDTRTDRVVAVEALVRWDHPTRGLLPPAVFIPIAEDAGLMDDIGRDILARACMQAAQWNAGVAPNLAVSVNVSPRQLTGDTIVDDVAQALAHAHLDPASLVLEITETAMMRDTDLARRNLFALDELGVGLALDDFGTGYSSLTYLQQFPIDVVKIDKSFVATIGQRNRIPSLAPAIIQLARTLGLVPVAEGVETHDQLVELRALGCDLIQGFLLHRPQSADALSALLAGEAGAGDAGDVAEPDEVAPPLAS
jgi:diguanylate cyclase (GGDEF)-like protein/PAS domain S-box-containing protein